MERRGFSFLITASLIFVGLILIQRVFFPPKAKPVAGDNNVAEKKIDEAENANDKQDDEKKNEVDKKDSGKKNDEGNSDDLKSGDDNKKQKEPTSEQDDPQKNKPDATVSAIADFVDGQLIKVGSLEPESGKRLLVTVNRRGGTIRRVELASRRPDGRLRYRDVQFKRFQGSRPRFPVYMGNLELTPVDDGLIVNAVGDGTPAANANGPVPGGIKVNDVIQKINGESVVDVESFQQLIHQAKAGQTIAVSVVRGKDKKPIEFQVELTDKPLEVIRPEPFIEYVDKKQTIPATSPPESLILTVVKPDGTEWPELDPKMRTGLWDFVDDGQADTVKLKYTLQIKDEAKDVDGELTVFKIFRLPTADPESAPDALDRKFHVNLEFEFKFAGKGKPKLAFLLYGPTGTPVGGWWYQNKIHGESTALFSAAGARDIVANSRGRGYSFYGGPKIIANVFKKKPELITIFDGSNEEDGLMRFVGVDAQYFSAMLLPDERYEQPDGSREFDCYSAFVWVAQNPLPQNKRKRRTGDISFMLYSDPFVLSNDESFSAGFEFFTGPKEPKLLRQYGLKDLRSFGWFAFISRPLCWLLTFFYKCFSLIGLGSYGLSIILLTILVRSMMVPVSRKAALNAQMMQRLAPQMKEIADKYKEDMEGRLKAQRQLFSKHKYNPYGGCLLMFLQLPIFIGLYRGLSVDMALRDQPLIPGVKWCSNLAGPDKLLYWGEWMPSFLGSETGWLGPYLNILPLITVVLFLMQQKLFTPPPTDDQQKMMHKMMTFMMLFMGVLFFKVSSGLCLYFITSSVWGIAERKLLPKPKLKDEADVSAGIPKRKRKNSPTEKVVLRESEEDRKRREKEKRDRERRKREKNK